MTVSRHPSRLPSLLLAGFGLAVVSFGPFGLDTLPALHAQTAGEPVSDSIDVEIQIVPFYAVDEEGKPVFDLKQEEVEIRLDGKPVPVDTFDSFNEAEPEASAAGPAAAPAADAKSAKSKKPRRHVVLFFDIAFSTPRGFESAQDFAVKMIDGLPKEDLLYLVSHDYTSGLKQQLGPVAASASGKSKMLAALKELKPDIGQITPESEFSMEIASRGSRTRRNAPSGQNMVIDEPLRTTQQAQLEGTARSLVEAMEALSAQFQRIHEPKLMVFLSQGIDPVLYWHGSDQKLAGVTETNLIVSGQNYTGIHQLFEKPLKQLADSGAMSLFVNLDDQATRQRIADPSMEHMARASGGLYLGGVDAAVVSDRFSRSTAAFYEAGFYLTSANRKASRAKMEVVVNRPGVRTWSAGALKTRETWRGLSEEARKLLVVDLIEGEARSRKAVRLSLQNLPGNVRGGKTAAGTTLLQFQAGWPQELAGRKIDLYNVLLEPARREGPPRVLRFDRDEGARLDAAGKGSRLVGDLGEFRMELPGASTYIWGIVAIEPATGHAWYRRFQLKGQP